MLWGLGVNLMHWTAVFFLPVPTPRVTRVGTMAFSAVMGFYQEGPLSHSHTVCAWVCVFDKTAMCAFSLHSLTLMFLLNKVCT